MPSVRFQHSPTPARRPALTALAVLAIAVPSCWSLSDPLPAAPCEAGHKLCDGICVTYDDPAYGCAAESCDPCGDDNGTPSCSDGQCAMSSCEQGWGDCTDADGCETDLRDNAAHCGMCGYDCRGATCSERMCEPIQIAAGQLRVWNVVANATHVYWTNNWLDNDEIRGGVWFTPIDATGPEQAQIYAVGLAPEPRDLAIDDKYVYWTAGHWDDGEAHEVRRAALGHTTLPAPSEPLNDAGSGPRGAAGIVVDADRVYWADGSNTGDDPNAHYYIWSVDKAGSEPPRRVADMQNNRPNILALDDEHVYWTSSDSGDLYRAPKDSPQPETDVRHCDAPSEAGPGWGIALVEDQIYWREGFELRSGSKSDGCPNMDTRGGKDCDTPRFMAHAGRCLFWECNDHNEPHQDSLILITRTDGADIAPGSDDPSEFVASIVPGGVHGMAVDLQWIYWTDYNNGGDEQNPNGGVYKVARPPLDCD